MQTTEESPVNEMLNEAMKGQAPTPKYNRRQRRAIAAIQGKEQEKRRKLDSKRLAAYRLLERWRLETKDSYEPAEQDLIFKGVLQKLFKHNFKKPFELLKAVKSVKTTIDTTKDQSDADVHPETRGPDSAES